MQENVTEDEWWNDAEELDALMPVSSLQSLHLLIVSGDGAAGLGFVPPPPRPSLFGLEELGSEAFTASCDLCNWAWRDVALSNRTSSLSPVLPSVAYGELGWALTLVIVALLSAVVGAVVMVTILHCRKLKGFGNSGCCSNISEEDLPPTLTSSSEHQTTPSDDTSKTPPLPDNHPARRGFWRSLFRSRTRTSNNRCREHSLQRRPPRRLCPPAPPANENHYTVTGRGSVEPTEEALYAELERNDPAYQNTGYQTSDVEFDAPASAPSSAYYSDLSGGVDRMYEAVGNDSSWGSIDLDQYKMVTPTTNNFNNELILNTTTPTCRIATITKTVPSDYV